MDVRRPDRASCNPFHGPFTIDHSSSTVNGDPEELWFSLNTCNGCHGAETGTGFAHIVARNYLEPSELSSFLTGKTPTGDPFTVHDVVTGKDNPFHDLDDRLDDLAKLVGGSVLKTMAFQPTGRVH